MKKFIVEEKDCVVVDMFESGLRYLGITNIKLASPCFSVYCFIPVGEDFPLHRRSDFSDFDAKRIDRSYSEHWNSDELPPPALADFFGPENQASSSEGGHGLSESFADRLGDGSNGAMEGLDLEESELEEAGNWEYRKHQNIGQLRGMMYYWGIPLWDLILRR